MGHRVIENDLVVYGSRIYVRWFGECFDECNDVLIVPERPGYSVLFSPSERLPVVAVILYSSPDIIETVKALVVNDVRAFSECLFRLGDVLARDVVFMNYLPVISKREKQDIVGPHYVVDPESLFNDLIELSAKLCNGGEATIDEVLLGSDVPELRRLGNNVTYAIADDFLYLSDGVNHAFIDVRYVDPFEVGEEGIILGYGIYGSIEEAHAVAIGEESLNREHLSKLLKQGVLGSDGRLKPITVLVKTLRKLVEE